ncbi:hypothetical protein TH53_19725 [Pedobacter lusitanus]|uniref:Uncharacterized protein n=1 Tax=Pedobacter lusitanus TaxID=1503925 RepID=A0A0D0GHG1_9SPHI|nr:hypothetical protein [Pedobacter lusitanus]KIO75570.1 hypothetical protein TH53_19725 [Pedobacter lusitanus]
MGAQPNDFRYFLTLDNNRTEIIFAPDGWDKDTTVTYKRSEDYFGLIRSLALPLQFVLDGATILRQAFYKYGIEAEVRIEVEVLNKASWQYKPFFRGDIDFSKFEDLKDHVSVTLMESGATRNIKAFEGVKYEYELRGSDIVDIVLPGIGFSEKSTYFFSPTEGRATRRIPAMPIITNGFSSQYVLAQGVDGGDINDDGFNNSNGWFVKGNRPEVINLNIVGRIKGFATKTIVTGGSIQNFTIEIRNDSGSFVQVLYTSPSMGLRDDERVDFDVNINLTFSISNNERLFFYIRPDPNDPPRTLVTFVQEGDITVSYATTSPPSICKGIPAINLYKRIMARITPGTQVESFMLSNNWKNLIFTCGDGIREVGGAKLSIAWKDFYKTFNGLEHAAFGLENGVARLESGAYFARNIEIINISNVKDFKLTAAESFVFNSVKIGYEDGNTDNKDGREEYNSGQIWAMPSTRIQKQQDWISPTRADQFGIEKLRLDYNIIKNTSDTSSDNDVFMVECFKDGDSYRPILGSSYSHIEDLISKDSAYNLNLTPKKNLLRHAPYLRSMLDKLDTRYINFGSGDKNTALLTIKDGVRVKENENIPISSLSGKYFLPYIATFTAKLPVNSMWLIDKMPFGYVSFTWNDVKLKGYILEISVDIAKNTEQEFKLLLTNDNDLQNLV